MSAPDSEEPQRIVDPLVMRDVLGHFASGVTVLTADTAEGPIGFTCQSFSSLSLEPPLVAFAPARTSRTWAQLRPLGRFCINVLAEGQEATEAELVAWCKDKAASYKAPTSIEFRDELARTATGKLQKFKLRAPFWEGRDRQVN